jgi:hypothetical protein
MALNSPTDAAEMSSVPERIVRPSEEDHRNSEDEGKRPLRSSLQPVGRSSVVPQPSLERASYDSPSHQQLAHWQPQRPVYASSSMNGRGHGSMYGNATANDYAVYDGAAGPGLPSNHTPPTTYPGTEIYFQPVYRGLGAQPMSEIPSVMPSRQPSMANRPVRRTGNTSRPQWQDDDGTNLDGYDETPVKKSHGRKRTNIYLVRGSSGGGGHGGSPPPEEMMRLPFTGFMDGTIKGRK